MDVSPDKQNIDQLFGTTTYYIDFYQRQYKWGKDPVEKLLDDVYFTNSMTNTTDIRSRTSILKS